MAIAELPTAREKHFREMAVWHEWPIPEEPGRGRRMSVNVGPIERLASVASGGGLIAYGMTKKRDVMGWLLAATGAGIALRGVTGRCHLYKALGITTAHRGSAEPEDYYEYGIQVAQSVTINASPEHLYAFWRDLHNLPQIMSHLESVMETDEIHSHWVAKGPLNTRIEWDAEIINEEPHELIAWKSLPGAEIDNAGSVRFVHAPGGRGTQVRVNIEYIPVAGKIGAALAKLFGSEPNQQVREDLRRFKQIMEAGESPTTEGQPIGRCAMGAERGNRSNRLRTKSTRRGSSGESGVAGLASSSPTHRQEIISEEPE